MEAVLNNFFTDVKEGKLKDAAKYVTPGSEYTNLTSKLDSGEYEYILKLVLSKIKYSIGDVSVDGSTAVAEVHIESVDLFSFYNKYNETLNPIMNVYLSGTALEKEKAKEQLKEFIVKKMPEDINSGKINMSKGDTKVNLVMKDVQWLINADESLLYFLTGKMTMLLQ